MVSLENTVYKLEIQISKIDLKGPNLDLEKILLNSRPSQDGYLKLYMYHYVSSITVCGLEITDETTRANPRRRDKVSREAILILLKLIIPVELNE